MLAKILVGVVAAIAVTGVGVYYAFPEIAQSGCCHKDNATTAEVDAASACPSDGETSCCLKPAATTDATPSCCAGKAQTNGDGLGACVGGMALTNATVTGPAKATHCCDE